MILGYSSDMITKQLNWAERAEVASRMETHQIRAAMKDILATLPAADAMDIATGSNDGGYYRDESSVLAKELAKRGETIL